MTTPIRSSAPNPAPAVGQPTTMKAAVYRRFGGPEVVEIEDVARPEPTADEVLIRVQRPR